MGIRWCFECIHLCGVLCNSSGQNNHYSRLVLQCSSTFLIVRWHLSCRIFPYKTGFRARSFLTMAQGGEHLLFFFPITPLSAILLQSGGQGDLLQRDWGGNHSFLARALTIVKSFKNMEASLLLAVCPLSKANLVLWIPRGQKRHAWTLTSNCIKCLSF